MQSYKQTEYKSPRIITSVFLVTVTGWYHTNRSMHCGHFLIYCASPSEFRSFLIHPPGLYEKYQQRQLVAKQGEIWWEMPVTFAGEECLWYSTGILKNSVKCCAVGPMALLPLWFLTPLKIHCHLPGFSSRTFGPMTSKRTTKSSKTTTSLLDRSYWLALRSDLFIPMQTPHRRLGGP
jgi:hypothetical protein